MNSWELPLQNSRKDLLSFRHERGGWLLDGWLRQKRKLAGGFENVKGDFAGFTGVVGDSCEISRDFCERSCGNTLSSDLSLSAMIGQRRDHAPWQHIFKTKNPSLLANGKFPPSQMRPTKRGVSGGGQPPPSLKHTIERETYHDRYVSGGGQPPLH